MGRVRTFVKEDIPQVAALHWCVLHRREGTPPPALGNYLDRLFFRCPWFDSSFPSLVYEDHRGKIVGFQGVVPRRMSLHASSLKVACCTSLVVHPDSRSTLAALHLLKSFLAGKQDLSLTDTANQISYRMWTALGGTAAVSYGMHWSRPLRPCLYGLYGVSRFSKGTLSDVMTLALRPLGRVMDAIVTRMPSSPLCLPPPSLSAEPADVDTLLAFLSSTWSGRSLRPEYGRDSLGWLLAFMAQTKAYGDFRQIVLRDKANNIAGSYLYYVRSGGIGEVVHIGAEHHTLAAVLDHLFSDASVHGALALHGRLEARLAPHLSEKCCFFYQASSRFLVHSRIPEVAQFVCNTDGLLTRLDGDWCLRFGVGESTNTVPFGKRSNIRAPISDMTLTSTIYQNDMRISQSEPGC